MPVRCAIWLTLILILLMQSGCHRSSAKNTALPLKLAQSSQTCYPSADYPLTRNTEPGGTDADECQMENLPSEYAWDLFFFINRQAGAAAGAPDLSEPTLQSDRPGEAAVWEGWALANEDDQHSEAFPCLDGPPVPWANLGNRQSSTVPKLTSNLTGIVGKHFGLTPPQSGNMEIRYNRIVYEKVRVDDAANDGLWYQAGISKAITSANNNSAFVNFDAGAKAVKAAWVKLCAPAQATSCAYKTSNQYHWRVGADGSILGLAALHIMSKEEKGWFWADFINSRCLQPKTECVIPDPQGTYVDPTAGSAGGRKETQKTQWANYRLMGVQTPFNAPGLSDPILENGANNVLFSKQTSCATCHFYASTQQFQPQTTLKLPAFGDTEMFQTGSPQPGVLKTSSGQQEYFQSDSLWSLIDNSCSQLDVSLTRRRTQWGQSR